MSEWRERANKRRDERQTKVPVVRPPSASKRDTKKWCRGKVGIAHKPVCVDYNDLKRSNYYTGWKVLVCEACQKQLDHYWPSPFCPPAERPAPPAWATSPPS